MIKSKISQSFCCYNKKSYLVVSYVIPPLISSSKKASFECHLLVFLRSYRPFLNLLGLYIYTNSRRTVEESIASACIPVNSVYIDSISLEDLECCHGHKGEHFQYAFSKLDALNAVYKNLDRFKNLQSIIISDIDAIILDGNKLASDSQKLKKLAAIDYRCEQYTTPKFDALISEFCRYLNYDIQEFSSYTASWINSGFVIIPAQLLPLISLSIQNGVEYMKKNKSTIKASCSNHYGDEILLSAIFNYLPSQVISLNSNPTAQLIWTCCTAKPTFHWVSLIKPPAHIHLPGSKLGRYQLPILNRLSSKTFAIKHRFILMINLWSIESHYVDKISHILLRKILKKVIAALCNIIAL